VPKTNVLLPIAGNAKRFADQGYIMPKPLIMAGNRHIIDWAMDSIVTDNCRLIFVVRNEHMADHGLDKILKQKFGEDTEIVVCYEETDGAVCSCLLAEELIDSADPLVIYTPDVHFKERFDPSKVDRKNNGLLLTFRSNSPSCSYVEVTNGRATRVAEKVVISNNAVVGVYYFKHGSDFVKYAKESIDRNQKTKEEYYITPVYSLLIERGMHIGIREVDQMHVLGTPEELGVFEEIVLNPFGSGTVGLCCDHSGFDLKEKAKDALGMAGIKHIDFGAYVNQSCDQVDYTKLVCAAIQKGVCSHGMGFCRTGQAVNIAANKFSGIRAAIVGDEYTAEHCIKHNGANFFSVPSKYADHIDVLIKTLKEAEFEGGRHQVRVKKIMELDNDS